MNIVCILVLVGCQGQGSVTPTSASYQTPPVIVPSAPAPIIDQSENEQTLSPFEIDWRNSFSNVTADGEIISLSDWTPQPFSGNDIQLPINLIQIANIHVLDGLTPEQKTLLLNNGFVVIHSQEKQFDDIREEMNRDGQPYYLTTDAAFHALHIEFDHLLKSIESEYLRPQMIFITRALIEQVKSDLDASQGMSIEPDSVKALAYLLVALKLFDPESTVDSSVESVVSQQVDQIMAAGGKDRSILFPDFEDDYGAYKPIGHYAGNPDLEAYFRGMTWYGRVHFLLKNPEKPDFVPSRVPLIITLALRRAQIDGIPLSNRWSKIHEILTFMIGPSDDAGPLEYATLMDQVYGGNPGFSELADDHLWQKFLDSSDLLPAPQINSLFLTTTKDISVEKGWRFMGQRFTMDGMILQNFMFDLLEEKPDHTQRELPSGLDLMAVLGSAPALDELEKQGATSFPNYADQFSKIQSLVMTRPESEWIGRMYDAWIYSFFSILQKKDSAYPAYMQTVAWSYKDLNTALGSWAELKHDTSLYTKTPDGGGGGGPPMSGAPPSYVEPNPLAFYRMGYMARTLSCGLQEYLLDDMCSSENFPMLYEPSMSSDLIYMDKLGRQFITFGDIAKKELAGIPLNKSDYGIILDCLGKVESLNEKTNYDLPTSEMPEVAVIASVAGAKNSVLEAGVGNVDRIYVLVPLEGQMEISQGGVFSYYEFPQPRDQRLTDEEWRDILSIESIKLPEWVSHFVLPGGHPTEYLFFRVGDVYSITDAGKNLNVREQPSINSTILLQLDQDSYVEIVDGPLSADGYIWWKIKYFDHNTGNDITGWAVEDQQWYARSIP